MGQALELVERWWTAFSAGDFATVEELGQPDSEVVLPGGLRFKGVEQVTPLLQAYRAAFPDIRHELVDYVESGDKIAVELRVIGTHTGTFQTPNGDIPATGKSVVWESVDVIVLRDGKIASWHTYFDQMAFLAQLGLLPEPATA